MNSTGISDQPATISDQIVQFAVNTQSADLPDSALQVLQLSLVDWVTVAIAGANEPVAKITRALVRAGCITAGAGACRSTGQRRVRPCTRL
jgi:2-methylcitrate dehydratase PrpD